MFEVSKCENNPCWISSIIINVAVNALHISMMLTTPSMLWFYALLMFSFNACIAAIGTRALLDYRAWRAVAVTRRILNEHA